jgi:hypothetical protein
MAVETVMMVPIMVWAMLSTLTYFEAYRTESINYKAGLTIADAISREADYITPAYIDGTYNLLKFLIPKDPSPRMRITAFRYRTASHEASDAAGDDGQYRRVWSQTRGGVSALGNAGVEAVRNRLPIMVDGERAILVETWSTYEPMWSTELYGWSSGLTESEFRTFTVISPRFVTQICWNSTPNDPSKAKC